MKHTAMGCGLRITKSASPTTYFAAGQVITYSYVITNSGNVTLNGPFTITDDKATVTCTASHTVTQADIDAGSFLNAACVNDGAGGATEVCDDVTTPGQEVKEETSPPTQPNTASTVSGATSRPADGSWLLIVGLAIALAAFVMATPQRGRKPR